MWLIIYLDSTPSHCMFLPYFLLLLPFVFSVLYWLHLYTQTYVHAYSEVYLELCWFGLFSSYFFLVLMATLNFQWFLRFPHYPWFFVFLKNDYLFIYLFIWDRVRERERAQAVAGAEGEAGSPLSREPDVGAASQGPEFMTWAEGRHLTDSATQAPWFFVV